MESIVKWAGLAVTLSAVAAYGLFIQIDWPHRPLTEVDRQQAQGDFIELDQGRLHYRWDGPTKGPVVVMVHGFSTPLFIFEQNVAALADAGYRVLRYDHFGRGWSDRPRRAYSADFYDQTLLGLLDGLGLTQPVRLVGLSMGGLIASEFTARHPDRVDRLFLFVPAGLDLEGARDGLAWTLLRWPVIGDTVWRFRWRRMLVSDPQYTADAALPAGNRLAGDPTRQMQFRGYGPALLSTLRHMPMSGQDAVFQRLSRTGIPILSVFGDADATIALSSADKMAAHLPEADIRIVEQAGHGLNYQNHETVNPWLVDWARN